MEFQTWPYWNLVDNSEMEPSFRQSSLLSSIYYALEIVYLALLESCRPSRDGAVAWAFFLQFLHYHAHEFTYIAQIVSFELSEKTELTFI